MLDIAIIGGGVCGLAIARSIAQRKLSFALVDARSRFGGRVLTKKSARTGGAIDLGPTWYWPDTEPLMGRTVAELPVQGQSAVRLLI